MTNEPTHEKDAQSPERVTALERLSDMSETEIQELYQVTAGNTFVREAQFTPTLPEVNEYFQQFLKGLEYAQKKWGREALPSNIVIYQKELLGVPKGHPSRTDFIRYRDEVDEVGVSCLHIAGQCCRYDDPQRLCFVDSHLPDGVLVKPRDFTMLQAIEECFHRYQIRVLGRKDELTAMDREHPLEQEASKALLQAIVELGIELEGDTSVIEPMLKRVREQLRNVTD